MADLKKNNISQNDVDKSNGSVGDIFALGSGMEPLCQSASSRQTLLHSGKATIAKPLHP